jgi:hypothetical protein
MRGARLPFEPLADYVGDVWSPRASVQNGSVIAQHVDDLTYWGRLKPARAVAVALGDSSAARRQCERWKHDGLTLDAAERVSRELRCTPWDIWSFAYSAAVGDMELV